MSTYFTKRKCFTQQSSNFILATQQNTWKGRISLGSDRPFSNENSLTCHGGRSTSVNNLVNNSSRAAVSQKQDMLMDLRRRMMIKGRETRQMVQQGRIHPSIGRGCRDPNHLWVFRLGFWFEQHSVWFLILHHVGSGHIEVSSIYQLWRKVKFTLLIFRGYQHIVHIWPMPQKEKHIIVWFYLGLCETMVPLKVSHSTHMVVSTLEVNIVFLLVTCPPVALQANRRI